MKREQKAEAVEEIGAALESADSVFVVDYRGISVTQAAELRSALREADASFSIVKNRLAKRATADAGYEALDEHLAGPTAMTYVRGDAVLAAKAIADFIRDNETIAYKGGIMEGKVLDPDQFKAIARLPGVDVLRGQLVGLAASPLSGLVRTMGGLLGGLASQLGQIQEQGLVGGDEQPAEPAGEASEADAAGEASEAEAQTSDEGAEEQAAEQPAADAPEAEAEEAPEAEAEAPEGDETSDEPQQIDEEAPEAEADADAEAGDEPKED